MRTPTHHSTKARFLVADDNLDDLELTRLAFERAQAPVELEHVPNGVECLAFLRKQGKYASAPHVDALLLDLNMPMMGGREVMAEIGRDPQLSVLPVIVLTTSRDPLDVRAMYQLRCSAYLAKPIDFEAFVLAVGQLTDYWLRLVELPRHESAR